MCVQRSICKHETVNLLQSIATDFKKKTPQTLFYYQIGNESYDLPNAPVADSLMDPRLRSFTPLISVDQLYILLHDDSSFFSDAIKLWNKHLPVEISI